MLALALGTLGLMGWIAWRANATLAIDQTTLPMRFGPGGSVQMRAPRTIAMAFMPGLAAVVLLPFAIFAPNTAAVPISAASLLAGQLFYHWLIRRAT